MSAKSTKKLSNELFSTVFHPKIAQLNRKIFIYHIIPLQLVGDEGIWQRQMFPSVQLSMCVFVCVCDVWSHPVFTLLSR